MRNSKFRWAIHGVARVQRIQSVMRAGAFAALAAMAFTASAQTGALTIAGSTFGPQACAVEGKTCTFTGTRKVAYGAAGQYAVRSLTGTTACNNAVFGDPLVGILKSCYLEAAAPAPAPGAQVCFFEHINYAGASYCVGAGASGVRGSWNDRVSSVRVPAGWRVELFEHGKFGGRKLVLTSDSPSLVLLSFNDVVSSYTVTSAGTTPTPTPTPAPRPCASQILSWTVAGSQCTASAAGVASGLSVSLSDTLTPTTGTSGFQCLDGNWGVPVSPVCNSSSVAPVPSPVPTAKADAARLLLQATYGPTLSEINNVAAMGADAWITEQFNTPAMDTHWDYVMVRKGPIGCTICDANYINATMESFWTQAVRGPDQLRQRTVFALSELFVVSTENSAVPIQQDAHACYLDMLSRNAFGNFRTLLEQVSTHPTMAHYLSHMKNQKEDSVTGRIPDENYAREVMQLFTIGLWQLNPDGSRKKDGNGRDIPTFEQADVMGLAKVFTGWSWNGPDKSGSRWEGWSGSNWKDQLQNYPNHHSQSEKRFLGASVPAGSSGEQSLKVAMDTLFNHPNVGPFIGSQLIKRFVTSNPSPAYVGRVAGAFNNNGGGVRGDMKAVLRAVLLDPEARSAAQLADSNWGKLREPLVRFGNWMRAFNASAANGYYSIWNLEDPVSSIGQNPLRAPSVFNWFRPGYAPPGEILRKGLVAPEFQITHETTTTGYANFVTHTVERGHGWNSSAIKANYSPEVALANNPAALMDRLNLLLTAGRMSASTRQTILDAVTAMPATKPEARVHTAVALTMLSPDFIVQK